MPAGRELTDRLKEQVVERWIGGESGKHLAKCFDTTEGVITSILNDAKAVRPKRQPKPKEPEGVLCLKKEQSYRENLRWAIDAAGEHLRSGKQPAACPNNSSWYLYMQAVKDPKDFLGRVGQIESKGEEDPDRELRTSTKHSIEEINMFLESLQQEEKKE